MPRSVIDTRSMVLLATNAHDLSIILPVTGLTAKVHLKLTKRRLNKWHRHSIVATILDLGSVENYREAMIAAPR
jgi:hypothetical protein